MKDRPSVLFTVAPMLGREVELDDFLVQLLDQITQALNADRGTLYLIDPEASVGLVIEAMKQAFPREPLPNVTAVGVNWLAGFQFEAKVIARIPQGA